MRLRHWLIFLPILALAGSAYAQVVDLAHRDPPRAGQWELLAVTLPAGVSLNATVSLQDARGGLAVTRSTSTAVVDPATGQGTILIPLPYLAEAQLPAEAWPLLCTLSGNNPASVSVRRPAATGRSAFRIVRPAKASGLQVPQQLSPLPMVVTAMADEEILTGPLLLFASVDVVLLSGDIAGKLSEERAADLMAAGVQLAIAENSERAVPERSALARFTWSRVAASSFSGWITPARPLARPQVLEPYLPDAPPLNPKAYPSPALKRALVLVPLACLVMLLLTRGLFRHPATILAASAAAFAGVGLIFVTYAKGASTPAAESVAWKSTATALQDASGSARQRTLVLSESFRALQPLFTHHAKAAADQGTLFYPVFSSSRRYFAMKDARLTLADATQNRLETGSHLEATLSPRTSLILACRAASLEPAVPPQTLAAANGSWLAGGYVYPDAALQQDGVILTQWVDEHPRLAASLLTWFHLRRFSTDCRYFILERETPILLDLGPLPATTSGP